MLRIVTSACVVPMYCSRSAALSTDTSLPNSILRTLKPAPPIIVSYRHALLIVSYGRLAFVCEVSLGQLILHCMATVTSASCCSVQAETAVEAVYRVGAGIMSQHVLWVRVDLQTQKFRNLASM